jgi:hypothetical protein
VIGTARFSDIGTFTCLHEHLSSHDGAHTMPWPAMAFSVGLAVSLLFAALHVARTREY